MIVTAFNPDVLDLEKSYLQQSYDVQTAQIVVRNNQRYNPNDRILIGLPGLANSEIVTVATPVADGISLPISPTLFQHEADAPVYQLQFDQVKFYRSQSGINGPFTLLAIENLDVTSEDLQTTYNDNASQPGYYYTVSMYNSSSGVESAQSDPIPAVTGWARNQVGYLVDQMYQELTDVTEDNLQRSEMIGYLNEVNDDLIMAAVRPYNFLYTREVFGRTAGSNTIPWPTDPITNENIMWKFDRMDYNYVDPTTNPITNITYTVEVAGSAYFRNRWATNDNGLATPQNVFATLASGGSLIVSSTYYYEITAIYPNGGETGPSVEVDAIPTVGSQQVTLSWSGIPGVTGYNIYRGINSGGELLLANVSESTTSFTDNGAANTGTQVPPSNTQNDRVQEIALDESQQTFNYYPASLSSSTAVWYLYYWTFFTQLISEGDYFQTPTIKIYKHYIAYKYYLKRAVIDPGYLQMSDRQFQQYTGEKIKYTGQNRRDVGTPRRFESPGRTRKSFRR